MGGYAISVNRFLSLTLSLIISVTSTLRPHSFPSVTPLVPRFLPPFPTWPVRFAPLGPLSGWSSEMANREVMGVGYSTIVEWRMTHVPNVDMCASHVRGQAPGLYPLPVMEEIWDFCACGSIEWDHRGLYPEGRIG